MRVIATSQPRRTYRQLRSLPDTLVFWRGAWHGFEFKRPVGGRLSDGQQAFVDAGMSTVIDSVEKGVAYFTDEKIQR